MLARTRLVRVPFVVTLAVVPLVVLGTGYVADHLDRARGIATSTSLVPTIVTAFVGLALMLTWDIVDRRRIRARWRHSVPLVLARTTASLFPTTKVAPVMHDAVRRVRDNAKSIERMHNPAWVECAVLAHGTALLVFGLGPKVQALGLLTLTAWLGRVAGIWGD